MSPTKRRLFILPICALIVGLLCSLVPAQEKTADGTRSVPATTSTGKVEGWANVPGGQVWLRPGIDAYEHDTGLVRDMRTGQKSQPITPQSLAYSNRPIPPSPYPIAPPAPPRQPYQPYQPYAMPSVPPPAYSPNYRQPYQYGGYGYDWGPGNVYYNGTGQPCNGCGAKLGSPGSINQRWTRVQ
jgi:hypothetical protein